MSYGLIGVGQNQRDQAYAGLGQSAAAEQEREQANKSLNMAEKAAQMQAVGMGAGIGGSIAAANIGASAGGLAGIYGAGGAMGVATALSPIAIGAVAAYALTELF